MKHFGIIGSILLHWLFAQGTWVETTQDDFRDGQYEVNIYGSQRLGGTVEFTSRFDLNNDGFIDLFLSNPSGISICWGSGSGYSNSNKYSFPSNGSGNCNGGDLNFDNWPDFIVSHGNASSRLAIYWGSASGFNPGNSTNISMISNEVCYTADLNRDGYIDIICGTTVNDNTGSIFWGSAAGYSWSNRIDLPNEYGAHNTEVADLNRDGYYDIIFVNNYGSENYIYWGSISGYSTGDMTALPAPASTPHGATVADFNGDNYLDLVFTSVSGSGSFIYYGSASGYGSYQSLNTGSTYGGSCACDINRDGYLDLTFFRAGTPSIIYWGSASGFSDSNTLVFGYAVEATGGFTADLNGDNAYDIYVNNRYGNSPIFWGPNYTSSFAFAGDGDHHAMFREIGNVYNRQYNEDYVSSVFDAGEEVRWGIIDWDDSLPSGSNIVMYVRSGDSPVPDSTWSGWDSLAKNDDIADSLDSRYLQYQAILIYANPSYLPYLYEVRIEYGPSIRLILQPDQADSTLPAVAADYNVSVINIGIGLDTVDLTYLHNTSWPVGLFDSSGINPLIDHNGNSLPDVIIDINDTVDIVAEITPPINAQGGEIDTLRLYGTSDLIPALQDSVRLITSIRRVIEILVDPDQSDTTMNGVPVGYFLRVINHGTNIDTVDLSIQHNTIWGISLLDSTGTMPLADHNGNGLPDVTVDNADSIGIIAMVYPPGNAQLGDVDTLVVTGRSNNDQSVSDNATLITVIGYSVGIRIDPDQTGNTYAGFEIRYDMRAVNTGAFQDTFDLTYAHNKTWPIILYDSTGIDTLIDHNGNNIGDLVVMPHDSVRFIISITPPGTSVPDEVDTMIMSGRSTINSTLTDSAIVQTILEAFGTIIVYPDQSGSGSPGSWFTFPLVCRNNQSIVDTIDVEYLDRLGYTYQLLDSLNNPLIDHNGNSMVDIPGVAALGGEVDFNVRALVPSSSPAGVSDSIVLHGYSGANASIQDSALLILTTGVFSQVLIAPDQSDSCFSGDSIDYWLYGQNLGNAPEVLDLACIGGNFSYSLRDPAGALLTDTDSDGLVDLGVVNGFGSGESLIARVKVPSAAAPGETDTLMVRIFSSYNPSITDDARIITKAIGGVWSLLIDPDQDALIETSQTIDFNVHALLQASVADVVDIILNPTGGSDWQVEAVTESGSSLTDSDGDGMVDLGMVMPGIQDPFKIKVHAPDHFDFTGLVDTLIHCDIIVYGQCSMREDVRDSTVLRAILVPPFDVHNFRNPFRSQTQFIFSIPKDGRVTLEIYNRAGELVRKLIDNEHYRFGVHYYPWDGRNDSGAMLAPGAYIYIMDFRANDGERLTAKKKAVILK
ncbi:MAG TPA: FG-GAP-like repeat-containing protein [bacterium]